MTSQPEQEYAEPLVVTELPDVKYDGPIPCPDPACDGEVMEIDTAVRFNQIYVQRADGPDGEEILAYAGLGQSDFEHDRFACRVCFRTINMPEGFEIQDWS